MTEDKHGRIVDRLRISLTDRCDLRCTYCMPMQGGRFASSSDLLTNEEIQRVAKLLVETTGLSRIRLTGGEPLLRHDIIGLVGMLASLDVGDIGLTTNAQFLAPIARELKDAGLTRVNISLDTLKVDRFKRMARFGKLQKTLDGIDAAVDARLSPVKVNTVLMRGENDDEVADLVWYCLDRGVELRFLELMAIGEAGSIHNEKHISSDEIIARLEMKFDLTPIGFVPGETAMRYAVSNGNGTPGRIGFISPVSKPFCSSCGRLRLSATGVLRGCLVNGTGPNLRAILREGREDWEEQLRKSVFYAISQKPWLSDMETVVAMHMLGG